MSVLAYFIASSAVLFGAALSAFWYAGRERRRAFVRLSYMTRKRSRTVETASSRQQVWQNKVRAMAAPLRAIAHRWKVNSSWEVDVQRRLVGAGRTEAGALDVYCLLRVLIPVSAAGLGIFVPHHRGAGALLAFGCFYLLPDMVLLRMVKARRRRIRRSLPDAVDLLVICVEAGLGLDQALSRVGQELGISHPDITQEFELVGLEQRAGKPRLQAWQAMAERVNLPELQSFSSMLMQTERFGTPIAKALSTFASGLRERRNQLAEEMAAKTTVKIIFPLIFCILPSMFIVLLGPAMITLFRTFPTLGR